MLVLKLIWLAQYGYCLKQLFYDHFNSYQIMIIIIIIIIIVLYLTDYKYKKDEIFKRMKVSTLVQLVCY